MKIKSILFWVIVLAIICWFVYSYSAKTLEWVHWQRVGLHTTLDVQFQGAGLQEIRNEMNRFLSTYDTALSDQAKGNAFEVLSRSPKNIKVVLNHYQQELIQFVEARNQNYEMEYHKKSPFQIGVAEWLHYYRLVYPSAHQNLKQEKSLSLRQKRFFQERIQALLKKSYFKLDTLGRIESLHDSLKLTLGGISKGFGLKKIGKILQKKSVKHFLVNAGGDLYYSGKNKQSNSWKIGIQNPDGEGIIGILQLPTQYHGLATSGTYEKKTKIKGKAVHHIINPLTGKSIQDKKSVTVLAKDPLFADFYATFLFLLPVPKALQEAKRLGLEALIIDKDNQFHQTEGMDTLFVVE